MNAAALAPPGETSVGAIAVLVAPAAGVRVLREVFRALRGEFPGAIVILLHEGDGRERSVVDNLRKYPNSTSNTQCYYPIH